MNDATTRKIGQALGSVQLNVAVGVFWYVWGAKGFWWGLLYGFAWPAWVGYRLAAWLGVRP